MSEENPGERFSPDDKDDVVVDETVAFTPLATPEGVVYAEESVETNFTPPPASEIPPFGQSVPPPPQQGMPTGAPSGQPNSPYTEGYQQPGQPFNQPYPGQTYEQVRVEEVPWSTKSKLAAGLFGILLGSFGVTAAFNVPRNERLARLDAASRAAADYWPVYVREWQRWNHVRLIASLLAAACAGLALTV